MILYLKELSIMVMKYQRMIELPQGQVCGGKRKEERDIEGGAYGSALTNTVIDVECAV